MVAILWSISTNAQVYPSKSTQSNIKKTSVQKINRVTLKVSGLTCAGCSIALQKEIENIDGVINNSIKYPGDIAIIEFDSLKTTLNVLKNVFKKKGFKVEEVKYINTNKLKQ
jgi:periplasmic mercuric ion binding protein